MGMYKKRIKNNNGGGLKRKRNNLDKAEAEFLYANVLTECNKYKVFENLSVTEKNNLIDKICLSAIKEVHTDKDNIEALSQEILSYKLREDELKKFYAPDIYDSEINKPENFNSLLAKQYTDVIKDFVKKELTHYD